MSLRGAARRSNLSRMRDFIFKFMKLKIITPENLVFEDEVEQFTANTLDGEITILPHHEPLVSILKSGQASAEKGKEKIPLAIMGGFIRVEDNEITVLADAAERAEDIDEARAIEARKRAQELMKESRDRVAFTDAAAAMERALTRLKTIQRKKHH